jgi:hypothetical protein
MHVILATQEAEIRRIMVQSQSGQIFHKILSRKYLSRKRRGVAGGVAQVKALSSSPHTTHKKSDCPKLYWCELNFNPFPLLNSLSRAKG